MMGMASNEVYCGQCFEEFYGQEYCQNLRKDLEKLKDELYDSDSQRFWREWVVPTVNLLRRLVQMGFPVRSKDFIVVHLYNPVDSMALGEMHFQVGRKAPGTLTLKFTKQNGNGAYVIQPKSLSNYEEMRLSSDPLAFLEMLRIELGQTTNQLDPFNTMQVLVLITDSCKLQRQCANTFLAKYKTELRFVDRMSMREPASMYYQSAPANSPISINQWQQQMVNPSFHPETSIRPPQIDGNYPPSLNFCFKNYVNLGAKTPTSELSMHRQPFGGASGHIGSLNHNIPGKASLAGRQVSTSTFKSEPEESDETLEIPGSSYTNELPSGGTPGERMAEIQRRMSDVWLWDAPSKMRPMTPQPTSNLSRSPQTMRSQATKVTEEYTGGDSNMAQVPISLPRSFSNDTNRLVAPSDDANNSRRHSEPKITRVEEYFQSNNQLKNENLRSIRNSITEKTSLTEEYVQESSESHPLQMANSLSVPRLETGHDQQQTNYRTVTIDSYIGENLSTESSSNDSRSRTSSLDAYIGEVSNIRNQQPSPSDLNRLKLQTRQFSKSSECLQPLTVPFVPNNITGQPYIAQAHMDQLHYKRPQTLNNQVLVSQVDSPDMSLLSQSTFPSWGSHKNYPVVNNQDPIIPLVVEKINRGEYQSWDHLASTSSSISSS